ncbi:type III pantothenate kinase [Mucilaginibacter terrenus]|uniref:Type III pantothenate kinase n=1 Tax=Mucilaginibacter terrenus TaxID=2482727 RepID=A0A3E2NLI0_9SPHI|nr:type III pantothenate kinase [Mucilaginibacter terrenus]RFZ81793.1 type III pantothenate kinase [Mucilaginibacter terrenus]
MANLVVDIGNTLVKIALFEGDELQRVEQYADPAEEEIDTLLAGYNIAKAIISSVRKEKATWLLKLQDRFDTINFNSTVATSINNHYKTPATLGPDRLAAVIGANRLYPGTNNMVISGGTTITYDYVDAEANYFGGSISPGLNMRYKALNYYTGGLPLLQADAGFDRSSGDDTASAITSGVQNGIKYELTGFIESYTNKYRECNIILSGGDSIFFDTLLKNSIFAPYIKIEPYLVLKGLNAAIQA